MASKTQSRYPGIRAFEQDEQYLFFGRQEETKRLYSLIKTQNLVVLFAKSGIGKSSLVNASIIPLLEKDQYYPVKIRFQDLNASPETTFKQALEPYLDQELLARNTAPTEDCGAWEYLNACRFGTAGQAQVPILVLDQFEEFFDHSTHDQNVIGMELADMVSNRLPNRIQDRLRSIPFTKRNDEDLLWHAPIQVKVLVAIRSDRISLLDNLSDEIPGILQNRFQLKPLERRAAANAIARPAQLGGTEFLTQPFSYQESVMTKILDGLSNDRGEIESFQLQLLCQYIERKLLKNHPTEKNFVVKESFFENEDGFKAALNAILNNYYENALSELTPKERMQSKKFIEEGLIIAGRRAGLTKGVEKERYQIESDLLQKLLDSRLIRQENTHLGKSYEISHDTLVAPILSSYEKRKAREVREAQLKLRKKERKRLVTATSLALLGFTLAGFALIFYVRASQAKAEAEENLMRFKEQRFESTKDRYQRFLTSGESYLKDNKFGEAVIAFEQAQQTLDDYATEVNDPGIINKLVNGENEVQDMIKESRAREGSEQEYYQFFKLGDELEEQGKAFFLDAKAAFVSAKALNFNNAEVEARIFRLDGKLENAFDEFHRNGKIFLNAEAYDMALENFTQALRIKPSRSEIKKQIALCKQNM